MGLVLQNIKNNVSVWSIILLISTIVGGFGCARMSAPNGGPKDEKPPVALESKPVNYATNFKGEKITILFDEYVVLKDVKQELLVSPPLAQKPETKQRGKNVIIKINNPLADSTTYNFNFYNAIADLNEGNLLKNFQFEFSTGPLFDSIYLGGTMHDAFDFTTNAGFYVMLYENFNDTMPRTTLPNYVAKTDEAGHFFVTNLKNKPYYIFGLNDMNNNMLFDLPNEAIAFIDSVYVPGFVEHLAIDTLSIIKSVSADLKDTVRIDSIVTHKHMVTTIGNIRLLMFTEDFEQQYFKQEYRPERQQVIFSFNRTPNDSLSVIPLTDTAYRQNWFVHEPTLETDSLVYWLTDTALINRDSLTFQLNYTMLDSNLNAYIKTDTLLLVYKKPEQKEIKETPKKKGMNLLGFLNDEKKDEKIDSVIPPSELTFLHNAKSPFDLNVPVSFTSRFPIQHIDSERILFFKIVDDTVKKPVKYNLVKSEIEFRGFLLEFEKDEEELFEIQIPAGTITDIYGQINDSLTYKFKSQRLDYYSTIYMTIKGVKEPAIVMLLDEKENILNTQAITTDTTLNYAYLAPKKYKFKLYFDSNGNGIWDTGNLNRMLQPERIFYYPLMPEVLDIKSNMDIENTWDLTREFILEPESHLKSENEPNSKPIK